MNTVSLPVVAGIEITTDSEGRYSLNALHHASGGAKKDGPSYWLALDGTQELILAVSHSTTAIPVVTTEGRGGGTFVERRLAVAYATWVSASFYLQVIDVFLAYKNGELVQNSVPTALRQRFDELVEAKAKGLISPFRAEHLAIEAIRSNWSSPAIAVDNDNATTLQRIMALRIPFNGRPTTIFEMAQRVSEQGMNFLDAAESLSHHGIRILHDKFWVQWDNRNLCELAGERPRDLHDGLNRHDLTPEHGELKFRDARVHACIGIPMKLIF